MNENPTPPPEAPPPEAPAPEEQPIPAELVRSLYVEQLEIRVDQGEVDKAQDAVHSRAEALKAKYLALFTERGLDPANFTINLKTGKITRKPTGPRAVTSAPEEPAAP